MKHRSFAISLAMTTLATLPLARRLAAAEQVPFRRRRKEKGAIKVHSFAASVALAVFALQTFSGRTIGAEQVPFKGTLKGSFIFTSISPPFIDVSISVTGNATQLGRFTAVYAHRVNTSTVPSTLSGTYTFTGANGDTFVADIVGQGMSVTPTLVRALEKATITGGTGRFAGASGEFVIDRLADLETLTTIGSFSGTISSIGRR